MHQFNVLIELFAFTDADADGVIRRRRPDTELSRFAKRIALVARRKQVRQLGDI